MSDLSFYVSFRIRASADTYTACADRKTEVFSSFYDLSFAFSYQGYYFGRSTNVTDAPPSSGASSNSLNQ